VSLLYFNTYLVAAALLLSGCALSEPVVVQQNPPPPRELLQRIAMLPFSEGPDIGERAQDARSPAATIQELVSADLVARGSKVVAPDVFARVLTVRGDDAANDLGVAARVAAEEFEATALLLGHVSRYRDRAGRSRSASQSASVAFQLTLRNAPTGRVLWRGVFNETQRPLSEGPARASRLPGGGMRWLTARELADWGVKETVAAMMGER
jgi:PBP1b-binding outer membrane lipoprotein LpoB